MYYQLWKEPSLNLLGTGTETSLNTAHHWSENPTVVPYLYAISAVLSDGSETLISDMVTNDGRDHDGLTNSQKYIHGTSSTTIDTDGDGYSDIAGVDAGTDPLNPIPIPMKTGDVNDDNEIVLADAIVTLQVSGGNCARNFN